MALTGILLSPRKGTQEMKSNTHNSGMQSIHQPTTLGGIIRKLRNLLSPKRALIIKQIRKDMNGISEYWNDPFISNHLLDELFMELILDTDRKYKSVVSPYFSGLIVECIQARWEDKELLAQQIFLEAIINLSLTHKEAK